MEIQHTKAMLAGAWILAACIVGMLGAAASTGARLLLIGVAFVPPLAMLLFWHGPSQTLSESIQRARQ